MCFFLVVVFGLSIWHTLVFSDEIIEQQGILTKEPVYKKNSITLSLTGLGFAHLPFAVTETIEDENYWSFDTEKFQQEVHIDDTLTLLKHSELTTLVYPEVVGVKRGRHNYGNLFW